MEGNLYLGKGCKDFSNLLFENLCSNNMKNKHLESLQIKEKLNVSTINLTFFPSAVIKMPQVQLQQLLDMLIFKGCTW